MKTWSRLLLTASALAMSATAAPALAAGLDEPVDFAIAPGRLDDALIAYSRATDVQVISASPAVSGKRTKGVSGVRPPREALAVLLRDSGLEYVATSPTTVTVAPEDGAGGSAGGNAVEALIVTAQKREENIQDVPIAISAFSQKELEAQKIEGGFDLLKAIPNVTFSKNNFTSYNFSIRGVGTKAVSATTDPGVAVSFNNTALIQNRLFEQEYFDIERVEVLRGPQGTLYGRNATSGVINVISAKPDLNDFDGWVKGEVGNFHTKRVSAMVNVPIIEDVLAVRVAGALTDRQGYDFNTITDNPVNGRDLWSTRLTIGFEPNERIRGNLIWERFNEDDDRLRTGKQLCHRDDGPLLVGSADPAAGSADFAQVRRAFFGQGCKPGSLYEDAAFGTPNGLSYNFVLGALALRDIYGSVGRDQNGVSQTVIRNVDPYGGMTQSRDMREIASVLDPRYHARADLIELNVDFDLTDSLTLSSQTAYDKDEVYSFQDYNRFNTVPVFTDTSTLTSSPFTGDWSDLAPGGVFCDPQIGCTDRVAGFDISQAQATQFSQEFRLQSSFDGPLNFSLGMNYTEFDVLVDYYIMFNLVTAMAMIGPFNFVADAALAEPPMCFASSWELDIFGPVTPVPLDDPKSICPYIDPQPLNVGQNFQGDGHNYYRSKNPYRLESKAAFGEVYWNVNETLKLTAGLRYTDDRKVFTPVPTQVLLAPSLVGGGTVARGYPEEPDIDLSWGEWTGRLVLDWQPVLPFTDKTMVYGSYSHGYKGGGANPPKPGFADEGDIQSFADIGILSPGARAFVESYPGILPVLYLTAVEYGDTFKPEFVDAFEVGSKNTLLDGALQFNTTAFYYDYRDYQVSQIRDRTAVNENFDATVWGLEFETTFSPSRNFQVIANLGYLDSKIADGETSIDIMNRTQSDPAYQLVKPWAQLPSNCVVPTHVAEWWVENRFALVDSWRMCGGVGGFLGLISSPVHDPVLQKDYDPADYPELHGGAGILADLGGNELPNAPHWTANVGAQYGWDFLDGWRATVRGDLYWQSQSFHRVYNSEPYDKLRGWWNGNLSLWVERPDDGLKIEIYVKNILDDTPITDAFLNSDDTGLTTNVFVLDPRLIGLSIKKAF